MYRRAIPLLLWASTLAGLSAQEAAVETQMRSLRIPRVSRAPKLNDFATGVPREAELVVTDFRQYRPGDGVPVSQPTTAFLSYDSKNIYIVFICKDDPKLIRARLAKHDLIMSDDRTMVDLDTFHDHRHMYFFNVNPYGVQADGTTTDGQGTDVNFDTLWHSEARFIEDGYIAMTVVPFKSIRFRSDQEQTWGLMLGRFIIRNSEWALWPYVSNRRADFVQQAGDLEGLNDISAGRNIQLIPYGLFSKSRYLDQPADGSPGFRTEHELRAGLDSKVILKDALTLDVALNPDFSQVESDSPQVTINQRYEVFFPEKRPFFMDNASYFVTPEQMLFTRRIVDPLFGARLTGKVGKWAVGALFADDRAPGDTVAGDSPWRGRHSPIGVVRIQRELSRKASVAAMATSQDFASTHNRVYSMDARVQPLRSWILTAQAMTSDTRLADGSRLAGPAWYANWTHFGRHFISTTQYTDRSPGFQSALGFFDRVDIRRASHTVGYNWRPEKSIVQSFGPDLTGSVNYDRKGRLQDWSIKPRFVVAMTRSTSLTVTHERTFELYGNRGFREQLSGLIFSSEWLKWFALNGTFSRGTGIDYTPGPGLDPFLGRSLQGKLVVILRPGPRLRVENTYIYSGLRTYAGSGLAGVAAGSVVFDNHIARSNVSYQYSRRLSFRLIADYNAVLPNAALMQVERTKHAGFDALFTYMLNPGTALHVGYTNLYDNLRLDPTVNPALQRTSFPGLDTGKQIFVKLSYLFRF